MADDQQSIQASTSQSPDNGITGDGHNSDKRDIQDVLIEIASKIPQEELDEFPPDFIENFDHYLYGVPKKTETE